MIKKKRVIILGSGGFVSSKVEKYLKKSNINCICIPRKLVDLTKKKSSKTLSKLIKIHIYLFVVMGLKKKEKNYSVL